MKPFSFSILLLIFLVSACSNGGSDSFGIGGSSYKKESSYTPSADQVAEEQAERTLSNTEGYIAQQTSTTSGGAPPPPPPPTKKIQSKIIKTADVRFQVDSYKKAKPQIEQTIANYDAVIMSENEQNNSYSIRNDVVIRVHKEHFDTLLNALVKVASYVENKSINAKDVTEEYFDVQTRLNTKKEVEKRFLAILNDAKTIKDILAVEAQLAEMREEIEAAEGRLKFLNDQVAYSTIRLHFHEQLDGVAAPKKGFFYKIGKAFKGGWEGLQEFIVGLTYTWPFLIMLAVFVYFVRKWWKGRKNRS